jgi:hypothetical protein
MLQATPVRADGAVSDGAVSDGAVFDGVGPDARWPRSFDALVIVRPSAAEASFDELAAALRRSLDAAAAGLPLGAPSSGGAPSSVGAPSSGGAPSPDAGSDPAPPVGRSATP